MYFTLSQQNEDYTKLGEEMADNMTAEDLDAFTKEKFAQDFSIELKEYIPVWLLPFINKTMKRKPSENIKIQSKKLLTSSVLFGFQQLFLGIAILCSLVGVLLK